MRASSFHSGSVSFQIVVPRTVKIVEAHSVSGSVTVRGADQTVDQVLSTISGSVTTNASRGISMPLPRAVTSSSPLRATR